MRNRQIAELIAEMANLLDYDRYQKEIDELKDRMQEAQDQLWCGISEMVCAEKSSEVEKPKKIRVKIKDEHDTISIAPEGYGDGCSMDDYGTPVILEVWEDELKTIVWSNIHHEDPTHIISMEDALETKR